MVQELAIWLIGSASHGIHLFTFSRMNESHMLHEHPGDQQITGFQLVTELAMPRGGILSAFGSGKHYAWTLSTGNWLSNSCIVVIIPRILPHLVAIANACIHPRQIPPRGRQRHSAVKLWNSLECPAGQSRGGATLVSIEEDPPEPNGHGSVSLPLRTRAAEMGFICRRCRTTLPTRLMGHRSVSRSALSTSASFQMTYSKAFRSRYG
jgi:hypothetical protein